MLSISNKNILLNFRSRDLPSEILYHLWTCVMTCRYTKKCWVPASQQLNTPEVELRGQGSWKVKLRSYLLSFRKVSWALRKFLTSLFLKKSLHTFCIFSFELYSSNEVTPVLFSTLLRALVFICKLILTIFFYFLNILIQILYISFIYAVHHSSSFCHFFSLPLKTVFFRRCSDLLVVSVVTSSTSVMRTWGLFLLRNARKVINKILY